MLGDKSMKKFVAMISASTLAAAAALAPILTVPALADGDMTARAYFSYNFGSGERLKNTTRYGFQLNQSWERGDDVVDPFAAPRSLTVLDFAMDGEGLAKANVLGLDTIAVYDNWTGRDRFNQNSTGMDLNPTGIFLFVGGGAVIACVFLDTWPCDGSNN